MKKLILALLLLASVARSATFTVDSTADDGDLTSVDGLCLTAGLECTLRAAIEQANATGGTDTIACGTTGALTLGSALPQIAETVNADCTGASGHDCGDLWAGDVPNLPFIVHGGGGAQVFDISAAPGSTLRGWYVDDFTSTGMTIGAGSDLSVITCNQVDGGTIGMLVDGSIDVVLGGGAAGDGNVVGNQSSYGISASVTADGIIIRGNFVGSNPAGTAIAPIGISAITSEADDTFIGGTGSEKNLIAGANVPPGGGAITLTDAADVSIIRNYIGVGRDGETDLGNWGGVALGGVIGAVISQNVIAGNGEIGIHLLTAGAAPNTVIEIWGNSIGVTASGAALGNGDGVVVHRAVGGITIGGDDPSERNVISSNSGHGIDVFNSGAIDDVVISGNYIGVSPDGLSGMGNGSAGVSIDGATNIIIGGATSTSRNIISGNTGEGVNLEATTDTVLIQNNYIGADANGDPVLCNGGGSIDDNGATNVTEVDNVMCVPTPTPTPAPTGCCEFSGSNDANATCIDGSFAPSGLPASQADCDALAGFLNEVTTFVFHTSASCAGGTSPLGVCADAAATPTPTATSGAASTVNAVSVIILDAGGGAVTYRTTAGQDLEITNEVHRGGWQYLRLADGRLVRLKRARLTTSQRALVDPLPGNVWP